MKQTTFESWWNICSLVTGLSSIVLLLSVCLRAWFWVCPSTAVCIIGLVGHFILLAIKRHKTKEKS